MKVQRRQAMPTVVLHGYTAASAARHDYLSDIDRALDVTPFVRRVRFSNRTTAPWETITLELAIPARDWFKVLPGRPLRQVQGRTLRAPETGFWCVVQSPNPKDPSGQSAVAWGRCTTMRTGLVRNGALIETVPVTMEFSSWCDLLQRSQIALSAGRGWGREGFVYRLQTWASRASAFLQSLGTNKPGEIFAKLWQSLVHVTVPNSLVAGPDGKPLRIGIQIPVVHDSGLAAEFAPMRRPQQSSVPGYAINSFATFKQPGGSLWDLFAHTFGADVNIVELFPSLEWPCYLPIKGYIGEPPLAVPEFTPLGAALGSQPVLIYRLKPYLLVALNQQSIKAAMQGSLEMKDQQVDRTASQEIGAFQEPVLTNPPVEVSWYDFPPGEILEFSPSWSDDDRINCVSLSSPLQPQSQIELFGLMGTPQVNSRHVTHHGFRQYKVDWPFMPATISDESPTEKETLTRRIDSLTEAAYAIMAGGESFFRGSLSVLYKPWVRCGNWMSGGLVDANTRDASIGIAAYIEGVTHDVTGDDGLVISASTTLDLVRGTLDEGTRIFNPLPSTGSKITGGASTSVQLAAADASAPVQQETGTPPDVVFDGKPPEPPKKAAPKQLDADQITANYKWKDLDPLNKRTPVIAGRLKQVAAALEQLRILAGGYPLKVTGAGGYQPANAPGWPARKPTSQHRKGRAADVVTQGSLTQLFAAGMAMWTSGQIRGLGFYNGFMHIDLRTGDKARWDERTVKTPIPKPSGGATTGSAALNGASEETEESNQTGLL